MNNNAQEQDDGNDEKWYKKISVEPTMFLYMFAFMLTSVVEQAFYLNKACVTNHGYSQEICDNLDQNITIKTEVQVSISYFHYKWRFCDNVADDGGAEDDDAGRNVLYSSAISVRGKR